VIGDSLARGLGAHLNGRRNGKRFVKVLHGSKVEHVTEEVRRCDLNNNDCLVIHVGSNDLASYGAASEETLSDFDRLTKEAKKKTDKIIFCSILPRLKDSDVRASRVIGVNESLKKMCKAANINFLDSWHVFVGRPDLFIGDGIHLNGKGTRTLAELINKEIFSGFTIGPGNVRRQVSFADG
jgi:lysophospholipase L1-like esterase